MNKMRIYTTVLLQFVLTMAATFVANGQSYENIYDIIAGRFSGVMVSGTDGNPNSMQSISVGGASSIRSSSTPLFVVDGVIIDNAVNCSQDAFWQYGESAYTSLLDPLAFLSVCDIESIDILKDQSATALYGSRGAAGVILISTKKGLDKKFHVEWNSDVTVTPGISQSHYVNVGGVTENLLFNLSGFFRDVNRNIVNLGSTHSGGKVSLRSAGNSSVDFWVNSAFVFGNRSNPMATAYFGNPSQGHAMQDEIAFEQELNGWYNDYDDDNKEIRSLNSMCLDIALGHFVKWTTKAGVDFRKNSRVIWFGNGTLFGYQNNGAAAQSSSSVFSYNASTAFDYGQYVAGKHRIKVVLLADVFGDINTYNTMNGVNFFTHELRGNGLGLMQCDKKLHTFSTDYFNFGGTLSAGYDYNEIAAINGGLRAEFTPRYGDNVQLFPFADAYLDISNAFFSASKCVSTLKIRGGYGVSGSQIAMPYELCSSFVTGSYPAVETGSEPYHKGFDRVISKGWHLSADVGFADDRVLLSASFYDNEIEDTYGIYSFGIKEGAYWKESARSLLHSFNSSFQKRGVGFDLNTSVVRRKHFTWDITANFSYEANILTELAHEDQRGGCVGSGVSANMNVLGQPLGTLIGYVQEEDGSIKDVNRDTKITEADKLIIGNSLPRMYGALGMNFKFHGVSIDMLFRSNMGHELVNLNSMAAAGVKDVTSAYVEDADWMRLSRLSIGYDVPLHLNWLDNLNINLTATDLFTITSYSGLNPDVNSFGPFLMRGGYDYGSLPRLPRLVIGISAKF